MKFFQTKVVTLANDDKYQFFHHHDESVTVNANVLSITERKTGKVVSYPLCNVERFETEIKEVK